jgi:hypothetical protein
MVLQYETKKRVMGKPSNKLKELQISNGTILYLENEADIPIIESGPPPGPN